MLRILLEEMLGISTEFAAAKSPSSAEAIALLAGCQDAASVGTGGACDIANPPFHIIAEVWSTEGVSILTKQMEARDLPLPVHAGSMGYVGYETTFVPASVHRQAATQGGFIPLEYYRVYTEPTIQTTQFFSSPWSLPQESITPCSETDMSSHTLSEAYLRFSNDAEGVIASSTSAGTRYKANCSDDRWWLSPRCRSNRSQCIPMITTGTGWFLSNIMQQVTAWDVPVAVGVIRSMSKYQETARNYNMLFYWYNPGPLFFSQVPVAMIWPWHNPAEYAAGNYRTASPQAEITKYVSPIVTSRNNRGMELVMPMLSRVTISILDVVALLEEAMLNVRPLEQLVCRWLNDHMDRVRSWIPSATECMEGQGLVSKQGDFVATVPEAERCEWCSAGFMSLAVNTSTVTYQCKRCDPGKAQSDMAQVSCKPCVAGSFAGQEGMTLCERCPIGRHTDQEGREACDRCPQGLTTMQEGSVDADCVCDSGSYRSKTARESCQPCKAGMTCPVASDELGFVPETAAQYPVVPLLSPGFWASAEDPLNVFRCESYRRCPGGLPPGRACAPLLKDQACAHCVDGYQWNPATKVCNSCGGNSILLFPVLPIAIGVVMICLLYKLFGDTYENWGSWRNGLMATIVIVVSYFQLLSIVLGLDMTFPASTSSVFRTIAWTTDVLAMFPLACTGAASFTSKLIFKSCLPLFGALLYVVTWGASHCVAKCWPDARMENNRTLNGYLSLVFSFIAGIADMSFTIFKCAPSPNGKQTLRTDRSVTCFEDDWFSLLGLGVANVMLWCVGFFTIVCLQIYRAPRKFEDRAFQMRWKFLFLRYRPDRHWWGVVIFAKAILANLGSVLVRSGLAQLYFIMLMVILYTALVFSLWPWRHMVNTLVDGFVHLTLIASCAVISWLARDANKGDTLKDAWMAEMILGGCQATAVSLIVPSAVRLITSKVCGKTRQWQSDNFDKIIDSMHVLTEVDNETKADFLQKLCEQDLSIMGQAGKLIEAEIQGKKARAGYHSVRLSAIARRQKSDTMSHDGSSKDCKVEQMQPGLSEVETKACDCGGSEHPRKQSLSSAGSAEDKAGAAAEITNFIDEICVDPSVKQFIMKT